MTFRKIAGGILGLVFILACEGVGSGAPPARAEGGVTDVNRINNPVAGPILQGHLERTLRYHPVGGDFVILNGPEFFNRPLYGSMGGFRVDAGDKPEFAFYLPGRGGVLRMGICIGKTVCWLDEADSITARYGPGGMVYEIRDAKLGAAVLCLTAAPMADAPGLSLQAQIRGTANGPVKLVCEYGGANGDRDRSNVDIGCGKVPVSQWFQFKARYCLGSSISIQGSCFLLHARGGLMEGFFPDGTRVFQGDAAGWNGLESPVPAAESSTPVVEAVSILSAASPVYILLQKSSGANSNQPLNIPDTAAVFKTAVQRQRRLAGQISIDTPDPFINAAGSALGIAANAVWDDRVGAWLHGAVAWRVPLLGWRGDYIGDDLGWHDRARRDFDHWTARQNTNPIPATLPAPEPGANLSRNETALHSNGDMSGTHYDMNLVFMNALFRHLLWTGDLDYARKKWPAIERHLAWERRLFRREYASAEGGALPLYEGYCCIWASDDLAYNGGGAAHSTAYNYFQNIMAARVARLIGRDPAPYDREADLIQRGMRENLWLPDRGWFAEWRDYLGLKKVHPDSAVWTFYETMDSGLPTTLEAWQMSRQVDGQIPHFPLEGPGIPAGCTTLSTTDWMPYTWSLNNVVMDETMHTALGFWQANRPDGAFSLFKGAILDSMYCGLCPGNLGAMTAFDAHRGEAQRDFADSIGITSRALVEGLFGVKPDLLAGIVTVHPGFPQDWTRASLKHPDFDFQFHRSGLQDAYELEQRFPKKIRWNLQIPAVRGAISSVLVNGSPVPWRPVADSVGQPWVEILTGSAARQVIEIRWSGQPIPLFENKTPALSTNRVFDATFGSAHVLAVSDPQGALTELVQTRHDIQGKVSGASGLRTVFARLSQNQMSWWQPVTLQINAPSTFAGAVDWSAPVAGSMDCVDMGGVFNDVVTHIFRNQYLSPRSPFCSLAKPKQGYGSWCHPDATFDVDDSGLRALAAHHNGMIYLPDGVPLATPGQPRVRNVAFVSQWNNYPASISVPLHGSASRAFLLMAGSTSALQSHFENGTITVTYDDGSTARLSLQNPDNWWPIDQDYFIDDFAFARPGPLPVRVDLKTGLIRILKMKTFKGSGDFVPGGAATVLAMDLNPHKILKTLELKAMANEIVLGLMSVTLQRP